MGSLDPFPQVTLSVLSVPPASSGSQGGLHHAARETESGLGWMCACAHVCGGHPGMQRGDTHLGVEVAATAAGGPLARSWGSGCGCECI